MENQILLKHFQGSKNSTGCAFLCPELLICRRSQWTNQLLLSLAYYSATAQALVACAPWHCISNRALSPHKA